MSYELKKIKGYAKTLSNSYCFVCFVVRFFVTIA